MSAVAASPDALGDLARRLRGQSAAHGDVGRLLGRAVTEASLAPVPVALVGEVARLARSVDEVMSELEVLARFVTDVADALVAADRTLAELGTRGGSGTSPWARVASPGGTASERRYATGVRRVGTATFDGPLRWRDRTRHVQVGAGSVRDGWESTQADVTIFDLTRRAVAGTGASQRFGGERAHLDVDVFAGAAATGRASAGIGDAEAHVSLQGALEVGAHARASAFAGSGMLGLGGGARVFAGARAAGEARIGVGRTGVDAHVEAHALAGGIAEADGEVDVLGVRTTGRAGVSYGLGGELVADAHLGLDKIELRFDVGATIGVGVNLGFDVSLSPRAVAGGVTNIGRSIAGWLS